jgi:restriction system protein
MAIPDYQTIMLPLLKFLGDEKEHTIREAIDKLGDQFNLTPEERRELLPSGQQAIFNNRVGWARTYMKKALLVESTRRGFLHITARGKDVIVQDPKEINVNFLMQYKEFREFRTIKREKIEESAEIEEVQTKTPEEIIASVYQNLRNELAKDIIHQIKISPPSLFEDIVIELMLKMGYGGSREDAGKAIGKAGDEGIDGIIKEDRLGLDVIYIQAKRWEGIVGRPEIQRFTGALEGQRARKGVFITTSDFSREAYEYASRIDKKVILIGGDQLAQYMIDFNIGVSPLFAYEIKKIDTDYFIEYS